MVNSHSHHPPKSPFNQFPHKEKPKFTTITNPSPTLPHEGKSVRDLLKMWLGRQISNKKTLKYTVLHETPIWEVKNFINPFRWKGHHSIFIILHHMLMETSKEQGIRDSAFHFITWWCLCWAAKRANYLQNDRAPSVPQHFWREKTCLGTRMSPRLTSTTWKAFACLTWVQPTALPSAAEQTKTLLWGSRRQLRHLNGISLTSSGGRMNFTLQNLTLSPARQKDC